MRLAFSGEARYPDYDDGYELYKKRARSRECMDYTTYKRVVRRYCSELSDRLVNEGMVDLPCEIGSVSAAIFTRKAKYRNGKFLGYGKIGKDGKFDGTLKAFGIVFAPNRNTSSNLRCYGFVTNRQLFKKVKSAYECEDCNWVPIEFKDEMI